MEYIIDRIEGEYAILETPSKQMITIGLEDLPKDIKEGDILSFKIEHDKTKQREAKIKKLMDSIWED